MHPSSNVSLTCESIKKAYFCLFVGFMILTIVVTTGVQLSLIICYTAAAMTDFSHREHKGFIK